MPAVGSEGQCIVALQSAATRLFPFQSRWSCMALPSLQLADRQVQAHLLVAFSQVIC